MSLLPQIA